MLPRASAGKRRGRALNVAAAIGAARDLSGDENSSDEPQPVGYFRIGYAM